MPTELALLIPLLGGFYFVFRCQLLYLFSLQLGQAVALLLSALCGFGFAMLARGFAAILHLCSGGQWLETHNAAAWPFQFSGTAMLAFWMAVLAAELSMRALRFERVSSWYIRHFADDLLKLLHASLLNVEPVCLTLDDGKIYIGFLQALPSLDPSRAFCSSLAYAEWIPQLPEHTMRITTDYVGALDASKEREKLVKLIPISTVRTANLFDIAIYRKFFGAAGVHAEGWNKENATLAAGAPLDSV